MDLQGITTFPMKTNLNLFYKTKKQQTDTFGPISNGLYLTSPVIGHRTDLFYSAVKKLHSCL